MIWKMVSPFKHGYFGYLIMFKYAKIVLNFLGGNPP